MTDVASEREESAAGVAAAPEVNETSRPAPGNGVWRHLSSRLPKFTRRWLIRWALAAIYIVVLFFVGVQARTWCWNATENIHFQWDMNNALKWGRETLNQAQKFANPDHPLTFREPVGVWPVLKAFVHFYDHIEDTAHRADYQLDYVPARLLVVTLWVRHIYANFDHVEEWKPEYAAPMLRFNYFMEILGALGAFLLARHWAIRAQIMPQPRLSWRRRFAWLLGAPRNPELVQQLAAAQPAAQRINFTRPLIIGLAAATFFWLDPAIILEAHGWPQWDIWAVPGFLLAAWAASGNRFFLGGCFVVFSAVFKGQILFVAPLFILWPLFEGRPGAAARFLLGLFTSFAVLMAPWLVTQASAIWLITITLATLCIVPLAFLRTPHTTPHLRRVLFRTSMGLAPIVFGAVLWPWLGSSWPIWPAALFAVALAASPFFFHRKTVGFLVAMAAAGGIFLGAFAFGGSFAWLTVGYFYATHHYLAMTVGPACNLALILDRSFGLNQLFMHVGTIPLPAAATVVHLMEAGLAAVFAIASIHGVRLVAHAGLRDGADRRRIYIAGISALLAAVLLVDQLIGAGLLSGLTTWAIASVTSLFGWSPKAAPIHMKAFLIIIYVSTLVLACVGMAWQHRRNDPRFVIAVTAPWLLMFAFLGQMHERYLLFGAAATAVVIAAGVGFSLLHLLLSGFTFFMVLGVMLKSNKIHGHLAQTLKYIENCEPDIGWAILLITLIWLFVAMRPRRRLKVLDDPPIPALAHP